MDQPDEFEKLINFNLGQKDGVCFDKVYQNFQSDDGSHFLFSQHSLVLLLELQRLDGAEVSQIMN